MRLGPYVADFVCREGRLIVEVDGGRIGRMSRSSMTGGGRIIFSAKGIAWCG
jgi:hypothetical protein